MAGKKDEIIDVTIDYIATNGASDISSKKIAEKIGCSDALIYKYYPSKEALVKGCLDHMMELNDNLFNKGIPGALEGITDPKERIKAVAVAYLKHHIHFWKETLTFHQISKSSFDKIMTSYYRELNLNYMKDFAVKMGLNPYIAELEKVIPLKVWLYHMTQTTTFFIKRIKSGVLEDDEYTHDLYFRLLFYGVESAGFGGA